MSFSKFKAVDTPCSEKCQLVLFFE